MPSTAHCCTLHIFSWVLSPRQYCPPNCGGGLSHALCLSWTPSPQDTLHAPQDPHPLQLPSTGQGPSLQMSWATEGPGQGDPPCSGAGLSHSLSLDLCPSPQVILHGFHGNQLPQSPSTGQWPDTQVLESREEPIHCLPPFWGAGLSHSLVRN